MYPRTMLRTKKSPKKLLAMAYFIFLFFAVFGIRLSPAFHFQVSHGYNLKIFAHLPGASKFHADQSLFSRYDWWINIGLFLLFPLALKVLVPKAGMYKIILAGVSMSICIELLQYVFDVGMADINDVIANTLGVILGCGLNLMMRSGGSAKV